MLLCPCDDLSGDDFGTWSLVQKVCTARDNLHTNDGTPAKDRIEDLATLHCEILHRLGNFWKNAAIQFTMKI